MRKLDAWFNEWKATDVASWFLCAALDEGREGMTTDELHHLMLAYESQCRREFHEFTLHDVWALAKGSVHPHLVFVSSLLTHPFLGTGLFTQNQYTPPREKDAWCKVVHVSQDQVRLTDQALGRKVQDLMSLSEADEEVLAYVWSTHLNTSAGEGWMGMPKGAWTRRLTSSEVLITHFNVQKDQAHTFEARENAMNSLTVTFFPRQLNGGTARQQLFGWSGNENLKR